MTIPKRRSSDDLQKFQKAFELIPGYQTNLTDTQKAVLIFIAERASQQFVPDSSFVQTDIRPLFLNYNINQIVESLNTIMGILRA